MPASSRRARPSICVHIYNATSTRWPGLSRFAIYLLFFSLLIAIAQYATILTLGIKLLRLPTELSCHSSSFSVGGHKLSLPLVVADAGDLREALRMGVRMNGFVLVHGAILHPLFIVLHICIIVYCSFRTLGLSNRRGFIVGILASLYFLLEMASALYLGSDHGFMSQADSDVRWCIKPPSEFSSLRTQKDIRTNLAIASGIMASIGGMSMMLYSILALAASYANLGIINRDVTRLTSLRHTNTPIHVEGSQDASLPIPQAALGRGHMPSSGPRPVSIAIHGADRPLSIRVVDNPNVGLEMVRDDDREQEVMDERQDEEAGEPKERKDSSNGN